MGELKWAKGLQCALDLALSCSCRTCKGNVGYIERIDGLMGDNAALTAQVARYRQHRDDYLAALEAALDEGPEVVNRITAKVIAARASAPATGAEQKGGE